MRFATLIEPLLARFALNFLYGNARTRQRELLVNLLRRDDLPFVLKDTNGRTLREWTDYEVSLAPEFGDDGHYFPDDSASISIKFASSLEDDDELTTSYYHAQLPNAEAHRVCCSMSHPDVIDIHRQQIRLLNMHLSPKRWFVNHDEIRSGGHEPAAANHTPGSLLRSHLIECLKVIQQVGGNKPVILNSDMYNPHQNAVGPSGKESYHPMVNGSFASSWKKVTDAELKNLPQISIWNWSLANGNPNDPETATTVTKSYQHFKELGYPQIVGGFYDANDKVANDYTTQLFQLAKQHGGTITGVCYYTDTRTLFHLEDFADAVNTVWGE